VPPDSFFQNNYFLLPKMVDMIRDFVRGSGVKHLVDLYCGVGFFGIELADVVESFVGVEYDQQAIKAARRNLALHNKSNGDFISAKVEEAVPELLRKFSPEITAVLLDPPRKGIQRDTLELLRRERPSQIIYVSCHPATMARDLNVLCADGVFNLVQVAPLDMFPQTQHVECLAELRSSSTPNEHE
jgi:23S rRNA (uracil1939-C5)-methyltransferase